MARCAALMALALGLISCGSSDSTGGGSFSCTWHCVTDGSSGTATYPASSSNPTQQCTADHANGCTNFSCGCTQS